MAATQLSLPPGKGGFRKFMKNKVFLNLSFAWGVFVGIHLERWLFSIGRKSLLLFL